MNPPSLDPRLSVVPHATDHTPNGLVPLSTVINRIRSGYYAAKVAKVRQKVAEAVTLGLDPAAAKDHAKGVKGQLPAVTFAGRFAYVDTKPENWLERSGLICADIDLLGNRLASVRATLIADPHTSALFTSPTGSGLKVVFRYDPSALFLDAFKAARVHVKALTGETIDKACSDASRLCFVSHDPDAFLAPDLAAVQPLDLAPIGGMDGFADVSQTAPDVTFDNGDPESIARARAYLAALPPAISGQDGSGATFKAALVLAWGFGFDDETALPLLKEYNTRCLPPWTDDELLHKLDGARSDSAEKPPFRWLRPIAGAPIADAGFATDVDASARFAAAHCNRLRYAGGLGWLHWDGKRWAKGADGQAVELAKQSARDWVRKEEAEATEDSRARRIKAALGMENAGHIRGAVALAESDPRMATTPDQFDRDAYLFNVQNGTLDLRTGQLRPHDRNDFITKLAPVDYVPDAVHPVLDAYLDRLDASTPGMAGFLARCFGVALTGDASPESLFLLQGDGGAGKTTLTEAFAQMIGGYAMKLPFESFTYNRHGTATGGAARSDIVALQGVRFAFAAEGNKSAKLDEGTVKALTGAEVISARELYKSQITFRQTWKIWLVSNFDPRADGGDTGVARRLVKIPFAPVPPEQRDPKVKETLRDNPVARSALLAWALKGCLEWQAKGGGRAGLDVPDAVKTATETYWKKQDVLNLWFEDFLAEGATLKKSAKTDAATLRADYEAWSKNNGELALNSRKLATFLESKGLVAVKGTKGLRCWQGIEMPHFTKSGFGFA